MGNGSNKLHLSFETTDEGRKVCAYIDGALELIFRVSNETGNLDVDFIGFRAGRLAKLGRWDFYLDVARLVGKGFTRTQDRDIFMRNFYGSFCDLTPGWTVSSREFVAYA